VERLILLDIRASAELGKNSRKFVTPCCILLESLDKLDMNYRILFGVKTSFYSAAGACVGNGVPLQGT